MDLNLLRTFQLVAQYQSFSRAATELHLTQPAVTMQIKNLETESGELLFERLGRGLALTPAGEALLVYAEQINNLSEQASETLRHFSKERGRLTIGAGTTNTIFRLPEILQEYQRNYPQIEIRIRNGNSDLITGLVTENAVDLGLVTTIDPTARLQNIPLFSDQIWLVAPSNYPTVIQPAALSSESLILFRAGSGFRRYLDEQFQSYRFKPRVTMELESIEAIIRLVHSGLGLSFLPEVAVIEEINAAKLRRVEVSGWQPMSRQTFLIHRYDKYLTWPIRAFLKQIMENITN